MKMFDPRRNVATTTRNTTRATTFLSAILVIVTSLLACRDALADAYPAAYRYWAYFGSNCPAAVNKTFPTAASAAESCAQSYDEVSGSTVCDWYFPGTMSESWPEPDNVAGLRVYTGPCGAGTTAWIADIGRGLSCAWGGTLSGTQCVSAPSCGIGITRDSDGQCVRKTCQECPTQEGNPIQAATANKLQVETDYVSAGAFPLTFRRFYNSVGVSSGSTSNHQWRHTFDRSVQPRVGQTPEAADVVRDNGELVRFTLSGSNWVSDADVTDRLVKLQDGAGVVIGWEYTVAANNSVER